MASKVPAWKREEIEARRARVAKLRLAHRTQAEIAREVGCDASTVSRDLHWLRSEWSARARASIEEWVEEELAKLAAMERPLLDRAMADGDGSAVDRVLRIMDRRAKLLGLDRPAAHEHTVISDSALDAEIARLEAELGNG